MEIKASELNKNVPLTCPYCGEYIISTTTLSKCKNCGGKILVNVEKRG